MSFAYTFLRPLNPKRFADQYREKKLSRLAAQGLGNQVVSKCGVTCVGSSRSGYGTFLNTVDAAGRKLAVVVCYNDFGAAYEAKQKWPDVVTVGMFTDIEMDGFNYANFKTRATLNPWIDYWCIFNEVDGRYSEQADRYITLLPLMRSDGFRLGMFSCASGTPMTPNEGSDAYAQIARACQFGVAGSYDFILCLHEYVSDGGTIGRFEQLADYLAARHCLPPIYITEYGHEVFTDNAEYMGVVRANDPLYMQSSSVKGCGLWTLGGGGWGASNYASMLNDLGQYIATVSPVNPPPPPPPPPTDEWEVYRITQDGADIPISNSIMVAMDADHSVVVYARPKVTYHHLSVALDPPDAPLTVSPASGSYPSGAIIEITIQ